MIRAHAVSVGDRFAYEVVFNGIYFGWVTNYLPTEKNGYSQMVIQREANWSFRLAQGNTWFYGGSTRAEALSRLQDVVCLAMG